MKVHCILQNRQECLLAYSYLESIATLILKKLLLRKFVYGVPKLPLTK